MVRRAFACFGLEVFDVEELPTHGGSLRIYCRHIEDSSEPCGPRVNCVLKGEVEAGLERLDAYCDFAEQVKDLKCDLLDFFIQARREHKRVAGYGARPKVTRCSITAGSATSFPTRWIGVRISRGYIYRASTFRSEAPKRSSRIVPTTS